MQLLAIFLLLAFLAGGTALGRHVRDRPVIVMIASVLVAASYYSLRVAM